MELERFYKKLRNSGSVSIAFIYIAISLVWILLRDRLIFLLKSRFGYTNFEALNRGHGFAFVIATGILLFFLIRRHSRQVILNENEYRELYEANPSPMWIYDPQTLKIISVNQTAITVYGYTKEQFLQMTVLDIHPGRDHEKLLAALAGDINTFNHSGVWAQFKNDRSVLCAELSLSKINFRGKTALMVLARDHSLIIAQEKMLKKANHDLANEKKRLTDIQELSKIAAWDYFIEDKQLVLSNEIYHIFGILGKNSKDTYDIFLKTVHRDDRERFMAAARSVLALNNDLDIVHRLFFGHNNIRYVRQLGKLEYRNGKPYKVRGTMQDITEIKQIERENNQINTENRKLATIITKINNMVVIEDAESRITWVNNAFEKFTGYTLAEIQGLHPSEFITRPEDEEEVTSISKAQQRLESFAVDVINHTKTKQPYWVNIEFTPMFEEGKFIGYISVHNNITTRKEKEDEITKQNTVLRNIAWLSSHEIRRPAASILGLTDLIRNADNQTEKDEYLDLLYQSTLQLDEIIHKINNTINEKLPDSN
ncbi:PAS domain S-box-containing protein [Mucilaginibacter gracilis]|uniref:histidine kinase n=1 Tax=Mucilaginibacter gracilis TaxID=423350 RepID=A0A495J7U9_9SPHI|nr:PAS domain S-box protein [Mucilaginibacter gracilis]RKR84823.1 PAS domain S-box-containing protein [Mucilaginibacter gracilis]